ncbi:MAG: indole-3-glycerol phosphate synthase TrpC [Acidimicrobiales bacterium]
MATYLDAIARFHRRRAAHDLRDRAVLSAAADVACETDPVRDFGGAIASSSSTGQIALVAEIKRRSPSKGDLDLDLDPGALAAEYTAAGASCLSVLTDREHFSGSAEDLTRARAATRLPVLRKDFTIQERDVLDARIMGADAVLLIAAVLEDSELEALSHLCRCYAMAALVEVHDEAEVIRALRMDAELIGVNQRDLASFEVDKDRALSLAEAIGEGRLTVAESGIALPGDVARLAAAGYDAVLVGEALVTSAHPGAAAGALLAPVRDGVPAECA